MEGIVGLVSFLNVYAPQATVPLNDNNNVLSISVGGTPANNTFKWYKDSVLISTRVGDSTFTPTSNGKYWAVATNAVAKNLTIYGHTLIIYQFTYNPFILLFNTKQQFHPNQLVHFHRTKDQSLHYPTQHRWHFLYRCRHRKSNRQWSKWVSIY